LGRELVQVADVEGTQRDCLKSTPRLICSAKLVALDDVELAEEKTLR